ncbi:centromere protein J-like [Amphibalanus amphitrite]|uniref:centromere protein J-like n=1 Tax=Amphibalanus amphitrite TaxID=1232801 RepID=UPI001C90EDCD|nr:centromere protein J-like [Amphibalanus amphitrite]
MCLNVEILRVIVFDSTRPAARLVRPSPVLHPTPPPALTALCRRQRELKELRAFELLEQAALDSSFSSNSSFPRAGTVVRPNVAAAGVTPPPGRPDWSAAPCGRPPDSEASLDASLAVSPARAAAPADPEPEEEPEEEQGDRLERYRRLRDQLRRELDGRCERAAGPAGWADPLRRSVRFDDQPDDSGPARPAGRTESTRRPAGAEPFLFDRAGLERQRAALDREAATFREENALLSRLRADLQRQRLDLDSEKERWERQKAEDAERMARRTEQERKKLADERKQFEAEKKRHTEEWRKRETPELKALHAKVTALEAELGRRGSSWSQDAARLRARLAHLTADRDRLERLLQSAHQQLARRNARQFSAGAGPHRSGSVEGDEPAAGRRRTTLSRHRSAPDLADGGGSTSSVSTAGGRSSRGSGPDRGGRKATGAGGRSRGPAQDRDLPAESRGPAGTPTGRGGQTQRPADGRPAAAAVSASPFPWPAPAPAPPGRDPALALSVSTLSSSALSVPAGGAADSPGGAAESAGSRRDKLSDGTVRVCYQNGDWKETSPQGDTVYFYAASGTRQTTYRNGSELTEFSSGQLERRDPDGSTEIRYPCGSVTVLLSNGEQQTVYRDGTRRRLLTDGSEEVLLPSGKLEVHTDRYKKLVCPDGTIKFVYPDGRQETRYPNGRIRIRDRHGRLVVDTQP